MARILVTEKLSESGLQAMAAAGHEVDVRLDLTPETLLEAVVGASAVVIRSATTITADVLRSGTSLVVVGRAGIGLDNVDVAEATRRGVMVVNAPESNVVSAAEHSFALLLAQARNIAPAHAGLVAGRWERSKWAGVEIYGKTLGIVGLGRIGTLVAERARAFGMELLAYDPYVSTERARSIGAEVVSLEELFSRSDFVTIHLPKTSETKGLISKEIIARAKPGLRLINAARGGLVDEQALAEAIASGALGGAGLDVFEKEPCTDSPLLELPTVVATPHLGASTAEAQDKAGTTIANQVVLALAGDFVPFAVNLAAKVSEPVRPFMPLAELLGRFIGSLAGGLPDGVGVEVRGALASQDTKILTLATLKGLLAGGDEPVSYVNAGNLAAQRGLEVRETTSSTSAEYVNLISVSAGHHRIAGTISGTSGEARIVMIDDHPVEVPPSDFMVIVRNDDRPGMIGRVGTVLGNAQISISNMAVAKSRNLDSALMVLATDVPVPHDLVQALAAEDGILDIHAVNLTG
jgi:D-3-phosphoglycerate dehydrogenase